MACTAYRKSRFISSILHSSRAYIGREIAPKVLTASLLDQPHRNSSFASSPVVRDLKEYPEIEVHRNPPEWKYVARLLPPETVPLPPKEQSIFPSGWTSQRQFDPKTDKYFIRRSKNHMIPVYLMKINRGMRQITMVRHILGDIWAAEKDLRKVIEASQNGLVCASRVNEMSGVITFHGNYVELLTEHLKNEGF